MKLRRIESPHGWTSIPNAALEDPALSWRATGLLAYLLSRPPGWETDSVRLASSRPGAEGRDAVRSALAELEAARYLHRVKVRRPAGMTLDGRYVGGQITTEWFVSDHPVDQPHEVIQLVDVLEPDADAGKSGPGSTPVDNPVEELGITDPPTPEKPTPENPASLTSNKNNQISSSQDELRAVAALPVDNAVGSAAAASPKLAALAEEEPAIAGLTSTDAIAKASRLEPGVQMFALRAHLVAMLGSPMTFDVVGDWVERAHESATPSRRGRLSTVDVVEYAVALSSPPELNSSRLPAARLSGGLPAAEPAPPASMEVTMPKVSTSSHAGA